MTKKVAIVGSGNVGSNAALFTALGGGVDVVLVDVVEGLAAGRALDLAQALAILKVDSKISGGGDFAMMAGADIVVVTAGLPRSPGMSRSDLLQKNGAIIESVCREIKNHAAGAIVIIVTNPLDVMTYLARRHLGAAPERVIGMGGVLDSGRFTYFLSQATGKPVSTLETMVIGAHSDEMVPLGSRATFGGQKLSGPAGEEVLATSAEQARRGGAQIVGLLQKGSAAYGPGAAVSRMVRSILFDEKQAFSTCCYARGEYGLTDIYINLPAVLGAGGVEEIIEFDLTDQERQALAESAEVVRELLRESLETTGKDFE